MTKGGKQLKAAGKVGLTFETVPEQQQTEPEGHPLTSPQPPGGPERIG